ncbi:MAG: hypothetical protein E7384_07130 [Ruminococcaceae bacterium]|nr:hypothetical protein [Oscillospiraceae bacterium]
MEYIIYFLDIIKWVIIKILQYSEQLKTIAEISILIIGGISAIKGINYLKSLREKRALSTFSFWTHFNIKLLMLKNRLDNDHSIINNLFSEEIRATWNNTGAPCSDENLKSFLLLASETLVLVKSTSDQMPAYPGWTDDYLELVNFLDDIFHYDISNPTSCFKFYKVPTTVDMRNNLCIQICETMNRLSNGIKKVQKETEKYICSTKRKF